MSESKNLPVITRAELNKYCGELGLNDAQIKLLLSRTPKQFVKTKPAKGGGRLSYVSGGYVVKVLNLLFGFNWDFEIQDEKILLNANQCIVRGRLTVKVPQYDNLERRDGFEVISKSQYGRCDIKYYKDKFDADGNRVPLDLGNDLKGAATDALKKCASLLGVAADIYAADDFREVQYIPEQKKESPLDRFKRFAENAANEDELQMILDDFENNHPNLINEALKIASTITF